MSTGESKPSILELVEAATAGNREAVETLLELYMPQLRGFVRVRAGAVVRRHEADSDIVQSVCREVLQRMDTFRHPSEKAFKQWLFTTALRKLSSRRDFYQAGKRDAGRAELAAGDESGDRQLLDCYQSFSTPSRAASAREEVERIEGAMAELSEDHREVITLAHLVGLSRAEIADQMGRSEVAVRVLLHRAMAALAVRLGAVADD